MTGLLDMARDAIPIAPVDLTGHARSVLLLAPHPDDETLGCGATIAALAAQGIAVQVVLVTDGAASHPASRAYPRERLAALRRTEMDEALRLLQGDLAQPVTALGYPDLAAPDSEPDMDRAMRSILARHPVAPGALWTTWAGDPHPDHQRVARLALRLLALWPDTQGWAYPIWGRLQGKPDLPAPSDLRVVSRPDLTALKARAIAAHASQMTGLIADDPAGFVMEPAHRHHFVTHPEIFIRIG